MAFLSDYDYDLPESMIASAPMEPRDECKMLVYDRKTTQTNITKFKDILSQLHAGDVVVINETRVIPARLMGQKTTGAKIEILLLKKLEDRICCYSANKRIEICEDLNTYLDSLERFNRR